MMGAYVPMVCSRCRRKQERWANSRFCPCGGRLALCEKVSGRRWLSFAEAVGEVLRVKRVSLGMTAAALVKASGLSKAFLSDVERGKRGISLENWWRLCLPLGNCYTSLLGEAVRLYRKGNDYA